MARVGSDLRADRRYWPRITYDLTVGPAGSEIRPYQSNRVGCLTLCKSVASTTSSWRAPHTIFLLPSKDQNGGSLKDGAGRRLGLRTIFAG